MKKWLWALKYTSAEIFHFQNLAIAAEIFCENTWVMGCPIFALAIWISLHVLLMRSVKARDVTVFHWMRSFLNASLWTVEKDKKNDMTRVTLEDPYLVWPHFCHSLSQILWDHTWCSKPKITLIICKGHDTVVSLLTGYDTRPNC